MENGNFFCLLDGNDHSQANNDTNKSNDDSNDEDDNAVAVRSFRRLGEGASSGGLSTAATLLLLSPRQCSAVAVCSEGGYVDPRMQPFQHRAPHRHLLVAQCQHGATERGQILLGMRQLWCERIITVVKRGAKKIVVLVIILTSRTGDVEQQRADDSSLLGREADFVHQVDLLDSHTELSQTLQGFAVSYPLVLLVHFLLVKCKLSQVRVV